ncbi:hypothetical protein roselon_02347 [Roseibacterium elongatum DSM 19469]|uniref:Uncharacterized protein n=1 Tax=Roseicyclus elongatus DSM 19469 TaxID=1294273 RepID=W8SQ53_9RHOB|nr:hypothetical protein roselon_02347 [Roseibacterium elongatum DSM 19469]
MLSNVSDARIGSRGATAIEETASLRPAPRPRTAEARRYPEAEASGALTLGEFDDDIAAVRHAPLLTPSARRAWPWPARGATAPMPRRCPCR